MSVADIKQYRQQNGTDILKVFCKPTKLFPEGKNYFYCPAEALDVVQSHTWCLSKQGNGVYVTAYSRYETLQFHRELCYFYHSRYADDIDHRDGVEIDNTNQNLNAVTQQQNILNHFTRGYRIHQRVSGFAFQPRIVLSGRVYHPYSCIHREDEACQLQYLVETDYLHSLMCDQYYRFDFTRYRRGSENILDLERTGKISEEEAIYHHILKYSSNAWYYHRYNLEDYFRQYKIPIPAYSLDEQGFMCHPITGEKLCPFEYKSRHK